jgi:hypothetical protein
MCLVLFAQPSRFGRRAEIIVSGWQSEPALQDVREIVIPIVKTLVYPKAENMIRVSGESFDFTI